MEGYKCDLCGEFYKKPIDSDTMFELVYKDITSYNDETRQICRCCLDKILEYMDVMTK